LFGFKYITCAKNSDIQPGKDVPEAKKERAIGDPEEIKTSNPEARKCNVPRVQCGKLVLQKKKRLHGIRAVRGSL